MSNTTSKDINREIESIDVLNGELTTSQFVKYIRANLPNFNKFVERKELIKVIKLLHEVTCCPYPFISDAAAESENIDCQEKREFLYSLYLSTRLKINHIEQLFQTVDD